MSFDEEVIELYQLIEAIVSEYAPRLLEQFGIGVDTAAEILIVAGGPERTSGRYQIDYGGYRQLNVAIYRTVIVRMRFMIR